jgi:hypothetical protein
MTPSWYVIASPGGAILGAGFCPVGQEDAQSAPDGATLVFVSEVPGDVRAGWFVRDGELVERDVMAPAVSTTAIAADGVAEAVVSGLPDPCTVTVSGPLSATATVDGGELVFSAAAAGTYRLTFSREPTHRPWSTNIVAS